MSSWRLRWLIIGPVVLFVMGTLMVSCGGGGGGCGGTFDAFGNFVPGFCATPGPGPGFNLEQISICQGTVTAPTPTPAPTSGPVSPTPTATLCPQAANTSVPVGPQIAYHAEGLFVKKSRMVTLDITKSLSTLWTSTNSAALQPPTSSSNGGIYQPVSPGCACIDASAGGIAAPQVGILVFSNSAPTPTCSVECPTPVPTTSATSAAASTAAPSAQVANRSARLDGILQWTFDPLMPLAGAPAPSADGNLYFLTVDGQLHALNPRGRELWRRNSGGENVAVGADRTVYAMGHDGSLEALSPHGKPLWSLRIDSAHGPLAASDGAVYVQEGNDLIAATAPGLIQWRVGMPGEITSLVVSNAGVVVAGIKGGLVIAVDKNGTQRWSFAPAGGFTGTAALHAGTVYLGSGSGTVYALDASSGSQLWRYDSAAPVNGGPIVNDNGVVFFASDATYALTSDGQLAWTKFVPPSSTIPLSSDGIGLFAPIRDGFSALLNPDDTIKWATGSFGPVERATLAPAGMLYVVTTSGRIYAIR